MPITHPLIQVDDVSFAYGNNVVLDHVSFVIDQGDYVGIIGPNGGGKTTLLKMLVGLLEPRSGKICFDGMTFRTFQRVSSIGYVPQRIAQDSLSFPATVYEVVESGRTPLGKRFRWLGKEDHQAVEKALDMARVADLKYRLMSTLSGGQRQRVYVARALASNPRILLLDEPFVGIDVTTQQEFYAFLKELNKKQTLTILFVSHDIDIISEEVTSVLCLNRGLLCFGKPSLLHEPHVIEDLYGKHVTHLHRHV